MEDLRQKLQELFESSDWTTEDCNWLLNYLDKNDTSALQQIMQQEFTANVNSGEKMQSDAARKLLEQIRGKIMLTAKPAKVIRIKIWKRVAVAAVLFVGAFALYKTVGKNNSPQKEIVKTTTEKQDIAPGGNKAVLTLADGTQIVLDSAANGNLTSQGNAKVIKLDNGQLAYKGSDIPSGDGGEILYNTITTPKGGQYQLVLSDGSKVWLNAASSLRFPASFTGKERKVELAGEGYFEVTKNASMPFKVDVAGKGEVEVLGTHFNINSYADEATINTTLLEGKVKVTPVSNSQLATQNSQLLSPGQQAQLNSTGQININKSADIDQIMAWKNGIFNFNNADLQNVLRQLSRWYDVDIIFEGAVPQREFEGKMGRDLNLSQVLRILEKNNVHFRIEGKKLIVTK